MWSLAPMPKQPSFDKHSAGAPGKKPVTGPVWLWGLAAVLLAAMTRKAYGCPSPVARRDPGPKAGGQRPGPARPLGVCVTEQRALSTLRDCVGRCVV
jgi:MYXO-CTERM domain-containing protein